MHGGLLISDKSCLFLYIIYTNTGKVETFRLLLDKVPLLTRRRSEHETKNPEKGLDQICIKV